MTAPLWVVRTDRIDFRRAWKHQRQLVDARRADEIRDVLWLLEHDPVFTTGRHGTREDLFLDDTVLEAQGASFVTTDRGGLMTWHGPGQSVAYVIHDLRRTRRVRPFVMALAEAMAEASGIDGTAAGDDAMGAYVGGRKIGRVGIRVSQGITMHGLALNREPDLEWFSLMTACGAPDVPATSIANEGGNPSRETVEARLVAEICSRLDRTPEDIALDDALPADARN